MKIGDQWIRDADAYRLNHVITVQLSTQNLRQVTVSINFVYPTKTYL